MQRSPLLDDDERIISFGEPPRTNGYPDYHRNNLYVLLCACKSRYPRSETGDWMGALIMELEDQGADEIEANCTIIAMTQHLG